MTIVALLAAPPRPGLALQRLAATSPLSEAEAAALAEAMLQDTMAAVAASGGSLLVNYLPDDQLPPEHRTDTASKAELRALAAAALGDASEVRFEPQVGSSFDARAGNTVTHLLREEGADSVAVVRGIAPTMTRSTVDSAAMNLRRAPVVLGPAPGGRVHYAAFAEPIDFAGAFTPPPLSTLADRARDADHDIAFTEMLPVVESGDDLLSLLPLVHAHRAAGRDVPAHTAEVLNDLGLAVASEGDEPQLVRD